MQQTGVWSLVGELRSHMPQGNKACAPWQDKACVSQQRPSTVKHKNKYINKTETLLLKKKKKKTKLWELN